MSLYLEFDRIVRALTTAKIRFAVVGGLAVGLHGHIRATEDIDLLVAATDQARAAGVMRECGYFKNPEAISFSESGLCLERFFHRPERESELQVVDFLYPESAATREYLKRAQEYPFNDIAIRVVRPDDLIAMKQLRGSKTDLADIEFLQNLHEQRTKNH